MHQDIPAKAFALVANIMSGVIKDLGGHEAGGGEVQNEHKN